MRMPSISLGAAGSLVDRLLRRDREHQRGAVLVLVALGSLVLLGAMGIGLDGSRLFEERRGAQAAADHAALAAAHARCTGSTDAAAIAAGKAIAAINTYDDASPTISVAITAVAGQVNTFRVVIDSTVQATFARVMGFETFPVTVEATGAGTGCNPGGASPAAVWAGGTSCPGGSLRNVEISGNDHEVNGLTHTNGRFENHGNDSVFTNTPNPAVEHVTGFSGGSNTYDATPSPILLPPPHQRWPAGFDPATYMTDAMWNAYAAVAVNSNLNASSFNITGHGVYYTENSSGVNIGSITNGAKFVIVARNGPIRMSNEHTGTYHAYDNPLGTPKGVIAVSGFSSSQPCDQFAFERSGNKGTWNGLFWTPRAMSRWSGNEGTINGGFITWAFQMNGNEHEINGGDGSLADLPMILLLK